MKEFRPNPEEKIDVRDLVTNFSRYWNRCNQGENAVSAKHQLLTNLISRVDILDQTVYGILWYGDYYSYLYL